MERFSFESGCAVQVAEFIKEDWPIMLQLEFQLKTTIKSFVTKVLEYNKAGLNRRTKLYALLCIP